MKQHLQPLLDRYNQLAPREQQLLLGGGAVLILLLLFLLVWEPLFTARDNARLQLADARGLTQQLEQAASQVVVARPSGGAAAANRNRALLTVVDQASRTGTLGKQPNRIQPDGEDTVRVWLEDIPLERLLRWMAELESRHGLVVASADIERREAGQANARLQISRAPG